MLTVEDINVYYGAIHAIKGISLDVPDGEIVALIGSNGAGKSTILKLIGKNYKLNSGKIFINNIDINELCNDNVSLYELLLHLK